MRANPGRVKLVFRPFPIAGHPHAEPAAEAAEWARDQGIFWQFHDAMFDNPKSLDTESLVAIAERLGKDGESLRKALAERKYRDRVQSGLVEGRRAGVIGTPTLFVNGRRHVIPDYSDTVLEFILEDEEQWMKNGVEGLRETRPPMRRFLLIDAHGRVATRADDVRRELADRAGTFELLPSAPDLLLAVRVPAFGGPTPAPGATLAGDLAAFPLADFLGFVHQARMGGTLTVLAGGGSRSVSFREGRVCGSSSEVRGERASEVATRMGFPGEGTLPVNERWRVAREQVTAIFHAVLTARDGVFYLVQGEDEPAAPALSLDTQAVLMDAVRRIDEMEHFRGRIPGGEVFLRRREPREAVALEAGGGAVARAGRRPAPGPRRGPRGPPVRVRRHQDPLPAGRGRVHRGHQREPGARRDRRPIPGGAGRHERGLPGGGPGRRIARRHRAHARRRGGLPGRPYSRFAPLWRGVVPEPDGSLDEDRMLVALAALANSEAGKLDARGRPAPHPAGRPAGAACSSTSSRPASGSPATPTRPSRNP